LLPFLLKKVTIMKQLLIFSLVAVFSISVFILLANDPSFASKFKILQLTADHFEKSNFLQLMLGVGFGNTVLHLGMGAHNLFVTHLVESGLVGLFLFLFFQLYLIYKSKRRTLYLTLPLFISGFSLVGHAIPYYYVSLAIIYSLSKRI
jgi:O-antigen ligase